MSKLDNLALIQRLGAIERQLAATLADLHRVRLALTSEASTAREKMALLGLTQRELSRLTGISQANISRALADPERHTKLIERLEAYLDGMISEVQP